MKTTSHIKLLIICSLLLVSCQTEEYEVLTEDNQVALQEGSEFYHLVERAAMHDGSGDDKIDESPCFSINFPYRVTLNGMPIKLTSGSDLQVVLNNLTGGTVGNTLSLNFPVTLKTSDYRNVTIASRQQLNELQEDCKKDIALDKDPITCVEIDFPVKIFAYNTNTQGTGSATIANKEQLFLFLKNKAPDEVLSFDYPITLRDEKNSKVEITTGAQFKNALKNCIN